jgi:hypothetical protein
VPANGVVRPDGAPGFGLGLTLEGVRGMAA